MYNGHFFSHTDKYIEKHHYQEKKGMALQSPGVEVTVIDESFYTPAEPGTTPLIVVASAQDKTNAAGTGVASATTKANAGKAFKITSQRDLVDLFGVPIFEKTASSSPVHGSERNEYGLLAAYSLLGVSNAAFIVRADVDLAQLEGQTETPGANPNNGQWWVNTVATAWGIQEWNAAALSAGGQKFVSKTPIVLTDADGTVKVENGAPKTSIGAIGDYAVVFQTVFGSTAGTYDATRELASVWYKSAGNSQAGVAAGSWVLVGSNDWAVSHPAVVGSAVSSLTPGSFLINNVTINISGTLNALVTEINSKLSSGADEEDLRGIFARNVNERLYLYTNAANDSLGDSTLSNAIVVSGLASANQTELGLSNKTYYGPALQMTPHTTVPQWKSAGTGQTARPTGSVWIKTTEPNQGARWRINRWNSTTETWTAQEAPIYDNGHAANFYLDRSGGGLNISSDATFVQANAEEQTGFDLSPTSAKFRVWRRAIAAGSFTLITSKIISASLGTAGAKSFTIAESLNTQVGLAAAKTVNFTAANSVLDADRIATAINAAGFVNVEAAVTANNEVQIFHKLGGDFRITDGTGSPIAALFTPYNQDTGEGTANFYNLSVAGTGGQTALAVGATDDYLASGWQPLAAADFAAEPDAPQNEPADGQLWYNPQISEVDIMIHNGNTWVGYRYGGGGPGTTESPYYDATPTRVNYAPIVSASNPFVNTVTQTGDLWISTADLDNYPTIYKYNSQLTDIADPAERWVLVDKTDQTTEDGILFADARWAASGSSTAASDIETLLTSNYLDPDAPDPALYPKGMLLWNTRRSGGNVKRYVNNYIDKTADNPRYDTTNSVDGNAWEGGEAMFNYASDRWVTASPNNEDGSGSFLRHAQRSVVVAALKSVVDTSEEIRDEERRNFNLIACPGYPELMSNLVNLNIDRGVTAFVVGDTPLRLKSDATTLTNWGTNANLVTDNGDDGIVTFDEYLAVFYPNGFTTDLSGTNAVVPASHMMLRTIALSDNASYPWFAPAGTRRGGITNATSVGYIDAATGEFQTVALNEGQRDTLYDLKINPIAFFNGVGHVNYGQKTRARNASALDRINVARLVVYLRSQLNKLARPYIFEPNDKITRDEVKQAVESLLLELVGLRALYDFAVVCDESNNTPARIDRNELWVDIAIEPVKAVEFIYIPLRVKNTGEI